MGGESGGGAGVGEEERVLSVGEEFEPRFVLVVVLCCCGGVWGG